MSHESMEDSKAESNVHNASLPPVDFMRLCEIADTTARNLPFAVSTDRASARITRPFAGGKTREKCSRSLGIHPTVLRESVDQRVREIFRAIDSDGNFRLLHRNFI